MSLGQPVQLKRFPRGLSYDHGAKKYHRGPRDFTDFQSFREINISEMRYVQLSDQRPAALRRRREPSCDGGGSHLSFFLLLAIITEKIRLTNSHKPQSEKLETLAIARALSDFARALSDFDLSPVISHSLASAQEPDGKRGRLSSESSPPLPSPDADAPGTADSPDASRSDDEKADGLISQFLLISQFRRETSYGHLVPIT